MKSKIFLVIILLVTSLTTGCKNKGGGVLVIGADQFNGVFSPFFAETAYDREISDHVMGTTLITNDRNAAVIDGIAKYRAPVEIKDENGNVVNTIYTFQLLDNVKFSDGETVTADDIIFTYKVLCDPTYTGSLTIYTTPIVGINEYRYNDMNYATEIARIKEIAMEYEPEEQEILNTAQEWADKNGMDIKDFLQGGIYYEEYILTDIKNKYYKKLEQDYINNSISNGNAVVDEISGIKKIDEKTVEITIEGVDPKAIWNLGGIVVAPEHYYGVGRDGTKFTKGDLSMVREKNKEPMGCGAYKFISFSNNVVTLEANENYYLDKPLIEKIKYQVISTTNKLDSVTRGDTDISDPAASTEIISQIEKAKLHYELIDNLGYGYIGINANRIKDINVRKGLMYLMNRAPAVNAYFGNLATVIERPMSTVSWAYPQGATEFYGYNVAKALECFEAAGYQKAGGKLVKEGKQLRVEIGIPGGGEMDHPAAPILTNMKLEMEKMGALLEINDCDSTIFFDRLNSSEGNQWDMWCAAWTATIDPDMYQIYHSEGPSNSYGLNNTELDRLITEARLTNDIEVRKEKYARCLDIIMEQAVEMPIYQRKNMYVFNPKRINVDTLPKNMTAYYGYFREVHTLETK